MGVADRLRPDPLPGRPTGTLDAELISWSLAATVGCRAAALPKLTLFLHAREENGDDTIGNGRVYGFHVVTFIELLVRPADLEGL